MQLIERVELTSSAASITFSNIPSDGTDLLLLLSVRSDQSATYSAAYLTLNSTNPTERNLLSDNGSVGSYSGSNFRLDVPGANNTASTFSNTAVYIPNYASTTTYKSISADHTYESNGTYFQMGIWAGLYSSNDAVSSITYDCGGNAVQYSTATLYKITKGSDGTTTVA